MVLDTSLINSTNTVKLLFNTFKFEFDDTYQSDQSDCFKGYRSTCEQQQHTKKNLELTTASRTPPKPFQTG